MSGKEKQHGPSRRGFIKMSGVAGAAALAGPQILIGKAWAKKDKQIVFISEESNPKAIKVYDKINADFEKETGIKVVMEYPGFKNIAKRVATLIASGTPAEIVWYGAGPGHGRGPGRATGRRDPTWSTPCRAFPTT